METKQERIRLENNSKEYTLGFAKSKIVNDCPYYINVVGVPSLADLENKCSSLNCESCTLKINEIYQNCSTYKITKHLEK